MNKLLREQKYFVSNKEKALVTKKYYRINGIYDKISTLQFNIKKYLIYKNYFSYKNFHDKGIGAFYISKNYINEYSMKVINFYKLMVHRLRLIAMKKIRSNYKYINEYNKEDINKVIFIQRIYLSHYYNKYPKKLKWNKKIKKIGIINKIRLKDKLKQIKLIQNTFRSYNFKITKFNQKLVRNKPISSPIIKKVKENQINIGSNKKEKNHYNYKNKYNIKLKQNYNNIYSKNNDIINETDYHSNNRLINNICFYSKEYKIDQMREVLFLQTKMYSFLFLNKLRKNRKYINKKNFNSYFFISKVNTNENECIKKINLIQRIFKRDYKMMKNNIIENYNSKSSKDSDEAKNGRKIKSSRNRSVIPKSPLKGYSYPIQNLNTSKNNNNKNKYSSIFKKNNLFEKIKNKNFNLSLPKIKKTLREKFNKNKTPKKDIKGNYISKKRVEKYYKDNYLTFNKSIFHQVNKNQCYYNKFRFYNNEPEIKIIQNFWRKMSKYNKIMKKPLNIEFENIKAVDKKENNKDNKRKNKIIQFKKIDKKFLNKNYKNYDFDDNNYIDKKSINNLEKEIGISIAKSSYILKTRKKNLLKYIIKIQNNIKALIKRKKYIKKNNIIPSFIYKYRLNIKTYNNYLKFIEESQTIIRIEKNYSSNFINNKENELLNYNDINFITKTRYFNFIPDIEKIQYNWRLKLESKKIYKKIKARKNLITKIRIRNNEKEIIFIQDIIKKRIFEKNDEKSKTVSRKAIISNALYNKKRYSKSSIKSNDKKKENKGNKNKINKKLMQNMDNYLNNINLKQLDILNKRKENMSESSNHDSNTSSVKSFNKKEFSHAKINYISKIYKYIIYKRQLNIFGNYFSKDYRIEYRKKKDYSFLFLLDLFITKNIQEYIYYLLKYNTRKVFQYPFYYKTLKRVLKYLRSSKNNFNSQNDLNTGEKIKKLFIKIFPDLYTQKNTSLLISSLKPESKNQLININIYNAIEEDFLNYLNNFSKYDKHFSNSIFIETRLKNTKLLNTNIFTIIKFLDDEYANLIYGKYCIKCFLDINKCSCEKNKGNKDEEYYYSDVDNIIDIEFDPYYFNKNLNGYDSIKWKDINIKRKPKTEEAYEDPFTHLIIKTKEQFNERKKIINSMNNTSDTILGTNTNCSYNSKIINKIKNDLESDNSMNNSKNFAKIKEIYHQSTNKKKENLILIKNNDY